LVAWLDFKKALHRGQRPQKMERGFGSELV
jgi:hypothetical protein